MQIDIDHLRGWIGREQQDSEILTPALVRQFNATFNRDLTVNTGDEAPLLIHFCLTQPTAATDSLGEDGHPARGGFLPPVPLPRRMWAGGSINFYGPIHIGETVTRRSVITDVTLKQGRTGALCFVTVAHDVISNGLKVLTERQDIVYRGVSPTGQAAPATAPAETGDFTCQIAPTAPLLFRYSALTFNGHRIHYDKPYATQVEGYPGLIVHGPMQATLLCQYAADIRGQMPRRFKFRSLSPIFDDADFTLNASEDGAGLKLWTARTGGPVAMEAQAEW